MPSIASHAFETGCARAGSCVGQHGARRLAFIVAASLASAACGGAVGRDGERDDAVPLTSPGTIITWGSTGVIYGPQPGNLQLLDNVLGELVAGITDERAGKILYTGACDPRQDPTFCATSSDWSDLEGFFATVARHGELEFQPISAVQPASYAAVIFDVCAAFGGWADHDDDSAREDAKVMRSYFRGGGRALVLADNFCGDSVKFSAQRANDILDGLGVRFLDLDPPAPEYHQVPSVERVGLLEGVESVEIFRTVPQTIEQPFEPILDTVNGVLMARGHVL